MNRNGPVIVIEDVDDDKGMLENKFQKLGYINKLFFFLNGLEALDFLKATDQIPFLILSDIYMPKLDGIDLRSKIKLNAKLQRKCIPSLFFSTEKNYKNMTCRIATSLRKSRRLTFGTS